MQRRLENGVLTEVRRDLPLTFRRTGHVGGSDTSALEADEKLVVRSVDKSITDEQRAPPWREDRHGCGFPPFDGFRRQGKMETWLWPYGAHPLQDHQRTWQLATRQVWTRHTEVGKTDRVHSATPGAPPQEGSAPEGSGVHG